MIWIKSWVNFHDLTKLQWMPLEEQKAILMNLFWVQKILPSWIGGVPNTEILNVFKVVDLNGKIWVFVKDYWVVLLGAQRFFDQIVVACDSSWFQYITWVMDEKHFCYELIDHWNVIAIMDESWEKFFSTKREVLTMIEKYRTQRMVTSAIFDGILKK